MNTWKVIQRKVYDILSHNYFLIVLFPCLLFTVLLLSIIQVGEVWSLWFSKYHNASHMPGFGRSCMGQIEIDAVYTWVNGSDPLLLKNLKLYQEENEEIERWTECHFPDCEPSHIVLYSGCDKVPMELLNRLSSKHIWVPTPVSIPLVNTLYCNGSTSLIHFSNTGDAFEATLLKKVPGSLSQGFWTTAHSAPETHPTPEWLRLSGLVPKFFTLPTDAMKKMLSKQIHSTILEIWPNADHSFVILKLPSSKSVEQILLKSRVLSIAGDLVVASRVSLVFNTPLKSRFDQYAPSRFEDKEELRYSLRSLEKHAPWIRHIYLVTNGQIPHWLDLDNPRITLVTHEEIFLNRSHLPTFSSPAIESHLHRIKGLSDKFLYLNDDIMFAQDVWPEDFYTNSRGFKIYLSWPVPDCSPTCLWSWVADGSCDSECNVAECGFDGGDCNETDSTTNLLKIRGPREEFSVYDDMYDLGFENPENLGQNFARWSYGYLQPPHQENLRLREIALEENETDDHLIRLQEPLIEPDKEMEAKREKRAAVKKNLASRSYRGSSMIAGQSADFPGSVTDSKYAIEQAMKAADKLRDAERPRHRSPFPQSEFNETNAFGNRNAVVKDSNHLQFLSGHNHSNVIGQANNRTNTFRKAEADLKEQRIMFVQESVAENATTKFEARSHRKEDFNSSIHGWGRIFHTPGKAKERLHKHMENDLNESIDQTLLHKGNPRHILPGKAKRRALDSFAESLLYVNMLYNKIYGFETRRVPAHTPHLIEKNIMSQLQKDLSEQWDQTSSHKLRSPLDMQFAFSYFYYLMGEETPVTVEELFEEYDTDHSGTWSDREIRTLLTRLYPAPLNPHHLLKFEEFILTCARNMPSTEPSSALAPTPMYERYQDSPLPTVTWDLVNNCPELKKVMLSNLGKKKKFSYEVVREWSRDVTFKMLHSNVSHLVGHLDDIRRNPKKFVCLNDNLDPKQESENAMVRAVLRDFYHSFFPLPSKFELPSDMRNRFLHVTELNNWKESRGKLRIAAILAIVTLCLLTCAVICPEEVRHYGRRMFELLFCLQRRRVSRTRCKSRSPVRHGANSHSV